MSVKTSFPQIKTVVIERTALLTFGVLKKITLSKIKDSSTQIKQACQDGLYGASCTGENDCIVPTGYAYPVCLDPGACQTGAIGAPCGFNSNCLVPEGLDHGVCWGGTCQDGTPGASCGVTSDCVVPQGLDHAVCGQGKCLTSPIPIGGNCYAVHNDWHNGCVIPPGLTQSVCLLNTCQSGQPGSPCRHTSDCVVQDNLDPPHAVCRGRQRSHCQRCVQCTI